MTQIIHWKYCVDQIEIFLGVTMRQIDSEIIEMMQMIYHDVSDDDYEEVWLTDKIGSCSFSWPSSTVQAGNYEDDDFYVGITWWL